MKKTRTSKDTNRLDNFLAYTGAALALLVIVSVGIFLLVAVVIINMRG